MSVLTEDMKTSALDAFLRRCFFCLWWIVVGGAV